MIFEADAGVKVGRVYWGNTMLSWLIEGQVMVKGWPRSVKFIEFATELTAANCTPLHSPENNATELLASIFAKTGKHQLRMSALPPGGLAPYPLLIPV